MTTHPLHPNKRDSTQVETLAGMGATEEFIAAHLNLTPEQLREYYSKPLTHGQEEANLRVAETFFEMATSGENAQATIAWLKMRAPEKWSERPAPPTETDESSEEEAREKLLTLLNRAHSTKTA